MGVQAMKHAALLQAWSGRIAECRSSGKTVKAWCEAEGVSIKTYYYWEKRIVAEGSQQANLPVTTQSSMLMRVNPETLSDEDTGSREACFTIRHGKSTITLPNGSSIETIADLVKALNRHV